MALSAEAISAAKTAMLNKETDLKTLHVHFSDRLGARLSRYITFSQSKLIFISNIAKESLKGAAIGAVSGAVAGGLGGVAISGPAGAAAGAKVGAKVGTVAGAIIKPVAYVVSIERSNAFRVWLTNAIQNEVFPAFQRFCDDDNEINDLFCMITNEFPNDPVRAPDGKVYDRDAITDWIARNPEEPSPIRGAKFGAADLVPAPDHLRTIIQRMNDIYKRRIAQMSADDIRREGFEKLREATIKDFAAASGAEFEQLLKQYLAGEIDRKEYEASMAVVSKRGNIPNDLA